MFPSSIKKSSVWGGIETSEVARELENDPKSFQVIISGVTFVVDTTSSARVFDSSTVFFARARTLRRDVEGD